MENTLLNEIMELQEILKHRTEIENMAINLIIDGQYLEAIELLETI